MDYKKLGKIMQNGRKQKSYTQLFVASMLGVTPQNISSWELGKSKMDIDTYIKLCNLYDLDFVYSVMKCSDEPCLPHFPATFDIDGNRIDGYQPISQEDEEILQKFHALDQRGKDAVMNVLNHEYESLPGEKAGSFAKEA